MASLTFRPSRTFALSAIGLLLLAIVGLLLAGVTVWALLDGTPDVACLAALDAGAAVACSAPRDYLGDALPLWPAWLLAVTGVAAGGAGAMGLRDYGSGGLTSSNAGAVLAGRRRGTVEARGQGAVEGAP